MSPAEVSHIPSIPIRTLAADLECDRLRRRVVRATIAIAALRKHASERRRELGSPPKHVQQTIADFEARVSAINARLRDLAGDDEPRQSERRSVSMRALLCDDESQSLRALRVTLRYAGFDVCTTQTAEEALDRAAVSAPDAAISELVLPDGDGVELCRQLREWSTAAIMMLSTVPDSDQAVRALNAGADDYLTKPFQPDELVARLHAILRRARRAPDQPRLKLHGVEIDFAARVVCREGERVHLTPIEFKLLRALATNPGRLLTHPELLRHGWGTAYAQDRQTHAPTSRICAVRVRPADGLPLIRTDHGVGYRFIGPDAAAQGQSLGLVASEDPSNPRNRPEPKPP